MRVHQHMGELGGSAVQLVLLIVCAAQVVMRPRQGASQPFPLVQSDHLPRRQNQVIEVRVTPLEIAKREQQQGLE